MVTADEMLNEHYYTPLPQGHAVPETTGFGQFLANLYFSTVCMATQIGSYLAYPQTVGNVVIQKAADGLGSLVKAIRDRATSKEKGLEAISNSETR